MDQKTIHNWLQDSRNCAEFAEPPESRQHFDIWNFQQADKDAGQQSYFGAMPPQVVENALWFWTEPEGKSSSTHSPDQALAAVQRQSPMMRTGEQITGS